jgi:hypothetical protein
VFGDKDKQSERRFREHAEAEQAKSTPSQEVLTIGSIVLCGSMWVNF